MKITIPNFNKYNDRHDVKNPSWVRLERSWWQDSALFRSSNDAKVVWFVLICMAKVSDGSVDVDPLFLAGVLRLDEKIILSKFLELKNNGLIEFVNNIDTLPSAGKSGRARENVPVTGRDGTGRDETLRDENLSAAYSACAHPNDRSATDLIEPKTTVPYEPIEIILPDQLKLKPEVFPVREVDIPIIEVAPNEQNMAANRSDGGNPPAELGKGSKRNSGPKKTTTIDEAFKAKCRAAWAAYAESYERRYGAKPVRSAKENMQIINLVKHLGDETADVLAYYLSMPSAFYLQACHGLGLALRDAPALRTQWATGRKITQSEARRADKAEAIAAPFKAWMKKIDDEEAKNKA